MISKLKPRIPRRCATKDNKEATHFDAAPTQSFDPNKGVALYKPKSYDILVSRNPVSRLTARNPLLLQFLDSKHTSVVQVSWANLESAAVNQSLEFDCAKENRSPLASNSLFLSKEKKRGTGADPEKVGNDEKKQGEGDARVVGMEEEDKRLVRPDEGGEGDGGGGRWNGCG
ncbi:hypothetical protein V6N12_001394 [Hibiscus sabdariffa]|uniref:Uncharacterized protein n=1 Tax=Hibiscus sabdariffa TaxID=183260 RepID=A0ABR2AN56_9ROSI